MVQSNHLGQFLTNETGFFDVVRYAPYISLVKIQYRVFTSRNISNCNHKYEFSPVLEAFCLCNNKVRPRNEKAVA
jgi:hypothetical protein